MTDYECEYTDPVTGRECDDDGTLYSVHAVTFPDPKNRRSRHKSDTVVVCPEHVSAVMATPLDPRREPGNAFWTVAKVQDVP